MAAGLQQRQVMRILFFARTMVLVIFAVLAATACRDSDSAIDLDGLSGRFHGHLSGQDEFLGPGSNGDSLAISLEFKKAGSGKWRMTSQILANPSHRIHDSHFNVFSEDQARLTISASWPISSHSQVDYSGFGELKQGRLILEINPGPIIIRAEQMQ